MATRPVNCAQCQAVFAAEVGRIHRAERSGAPLYCSRACAGLARRLANPPTDAARRAAKAEYDRKYRERNAESRKQYRAEYFQRTYDPAAAAIVRKARMPKHVEYCRRPEYRSWKQEYDRTRKDAEYGDLGEAFRLLQELEKEIRSQASAYERRVANGYYTRNAQKRRRELCRIRRKSMHSVQPI